MITFSRKTKTYLAHNQTFHSRFTKSDRKRKKVILSTVIFCRPCGINQLQVTAWGIPIQTVIPQRAINTYLITLNCLLSDLKGLKVIYFL